MDACYDYFLPLIVSFTLILLSGVIGYAMQPRSKKITLVILIQLGVCIFIMMIFGFMLEWLGGITVK